jgi:hypothetical protein
MTPRRRALPQMGETPGHPLRRTGRIHKNPIEFRFPWELLARTFGHHHAPHAEAIDVRKEGLDPFGRIIVGHKEAGIFHVLGDLRSFPARRSTEIQNALPRFGPQRLHGKKLGSFLDVVVAKPVLQSIPRRDFSPYFKAGFVPRKRPKIKTLPLKTPTEVRRIDAQSIRADHRGQGAENCLPKGFPLGDDLAISLHNKILAPKTSFVERI